MERESKIKEKDPFKIPEGYFDQVTDIILDKTVSKPGRKKGKILEIAKPALMLAAAMIGLVIISYAGLRILIPEKEINMNYDLAEISEYALNEIDDLSIIKQLINEQADQQEFQTEDDTEDNDIINYLLDDDIDYTIILEQYLNQGE